MSKLEVAQSTEDDSCATFVIYNEDHTLGNSLRWCLAKNPKVSFAGYSIPHPSEPKLQVRVQTTGCPATETLAEATQTLTAITSHVYETFTEEVEKFKSQQ